MTDEKLLNLTEDEYQALLCDLFTNMNSYTDQLKLCLNERDIEAASDIIVSLYAGVNLMAVYATFYDMKKSELNLNGNPSTDS